MPHKIVQFGSGSRVYLFPDTQDQFATNFANVVPATQRLPGLSGGFDEYGDVAAPSEVGSVRLGFTLEASSLIEMTALRDAANAMREWGPQYLWMQPTDPLMQLRRCRARINSIQMPERLDEHTDLFQRVTIDFQVADPHWYSLGTEAFSWGDGTLWGGGAKWGGSAVPVAASGLQTNFVITPLGNAVTRPRITIVCGGGQTALNPKVQRLVGSAVVDEVAWTGTLVAGDSLEINCRGWFVKKNGVDAYTSSFSFVHPDWFRLLSGANNIRVVLGAVGNACSVTTRYYEAFV